ncbi:putative RNA-dependent RNA polymerase SHL2-like [Tropilaelaps mercedesae]|uniref:RNA-directed RNA polymerase n=1 Tax=Tropilaelaps mercedesae TaxID=418985 RepID=A0A1V9Y0H6_9ACAR|nr:putative RNA-dependent RNA polymerase SHL2-like [Tropilaelaps mercedesae]
MEAPHEEQKPTRTRFVVDFLRSNATTEDERAQEYNNHVSAVKRFFDSHPNLVRSHTFTQLCSSRSGANSTRRKFNESLYEAPFMEAVFQLECAKPTYEALPNLYIEWCKNPPIRAWVGRGVDLPLFDNKREWLTSSKIDLEKMVFGTMDGLLTFCPEYSINPKKSSKEAPDSVVSVTANFQHAHCQLSLVIKHIHSCRQYRGEKRLYRLEIKYRSIVRAILHLTDVAEIYLRLTNPGALFAFERENDPKTLYRTTCLGCSEKCNLNSAHLRRLGGSNTLRLKLPNLFLKVLHRFLNRLSIAEGFVGQVETVKRPACIKKVREYLTNHLYNRIPFRAAYAIDSCKLISLDLIRQLARQSEEEMKQFCSRLEERANEDLKLFERAMFQITQAVDQGSVVIYTQAVDHILAKLKKQEREKKKHKTDKIDDEAPVQGMRLVYKVYATPSRTILRPPAEHGDNRILREVDPDRMLRIAFLDDDQKPLTHACTGKYGRGFLDQVVHVFLKEGVKLVGRTYEYLAASSSQLREHGCWMYAKDEEGRTAMTIRKSMGNFDDIKYVGKKMAREGQCFSSTTETVKVSDEEYEIHEDIKHGENASGNPYVFSDGIGRISKELRNDVCAALEAVLKKKIPSAFQIRYRGAKGMVAFDPKLMGRRLILRKSMVKFTCENSDALEVIKVSEERNVTLNRQIITILEQLGVHPDVFLHYQERNIIDFTDALLMESAAAALLCSYVKGGETGWLKLNFREFQDNHMSIIRDPYFRSVLLTLYDSVIGNLRSKSRIAIPWNLGRNLLGVLDETGKLEYGEVYVQYTVREGSLGEDWDKISETKKKAKENDGDDKSATEPGNEENAALKGETKILKGPVVVTKCPCVAPGDVRMLTAVDVPELAHLKDVIVFPKKGPRPHPNEMAGSDLDGDEYVVIWDSRFFFQCPCEPCVERRENAKSNSSPSRLAELSNHPAMAFPDDPPVEKDNITLEDYFSFFCDYIMNDQVGRVSNAHLACADQEPEGIFSQKCLSLAQKLSTCLDSAKTGRKDILTAQDIPSRYPDFMEKQSHKRTYRSKRALGRLFRSCRFLEASFNLTSMGQNDRYVNELFILPGWETMRKYAHQLVKKYDERLSKIMTQVGVASEPEIMAGLITQFDKYQSQSFHEVEERQERLGHQRTYLCSRMMADFDEYVVESLPENPSEEQKAENKLYLASACYSVVYNPQDGDPSTEFRGLPWLFSEYLMQCLNLKRGLIQHGFYPLPNCPITEKITEAIKAKHGDQAVLASRRQSNAVFNTLVDWVEREDLLQQNVDPEHRHSDAQEEKPLICIFCLHTLYKMSHESTMFEENYDNTTGSDVFLFIRYCSMEFESKTSIKKMTFTCKQRCAMSQGDTAIRERITMAAMRTYSRLAVSGDICVIKGLSCGARHDTGSHLSQTRREGSPMVLCVYTEKGRALFNDYKKELESIFKTWCGADSPEDELSIISKDNRDKFQIAVVLVARELAHYKLEECLYRYDNENMLIKDLIAELEQRGESLRLHAGMDKK